MFSCFCNREQKSLHSLRFLHPPYLCIWKYISFKILFQNQIWLKYYHFVPHSILSYSQVAQGLTAQIYRGTSDKCSDTNFTSSEAVSGVSFQNKILTYFQLKEIAVLLLSWTAILEKLSVTSADSTLMHLTSICSP